MIKGGKKMYKSFNPCCAGCSSGSSARKLAEQGNRSFNPCCAGCSSGSKGGRWETVAFLSVSILVVLDVVLEGCIRG